MGRAENKVKVKMFVVVFRKFWCPLTLVLLCSSLVPPAYGQSVARRWNEALLDAIRIDFPAPTIHSRNLYHTSAAMYDAWATFDSVAQGHFYTEKQSVDGLDRSAARDEAISYAAYRVLSQRYALAEDPVASQLLFDDLMADLGYDTGFTDQNGNSPAAIGNRIGALILESTFEDGSNEAAGYVDNTGYGAANVPMVVEYPGLVTPDAPPFVDPNRWQPLFLNEAVTQNDLEGDDLQTFIGPHWGDVTTFALAKGQDVDVSWSVVDPGPPPMFDGVGDAEFRSDTMLLIRYSNGLDPVKGSGAETINVSPNTIGNRPLGTHDDVGYAVNPVTGEAYADNFVNAADYGRILAEFWADGPDSETPPGHWNVLANEVADDPHFEKRIGGQGPIVDDLEWDVKTYLALNGAVHDAAVAAWGVKREYDYVRPITKIRFQGGLGQSTDPDLPSYHVDGLPLEEGLVELITAESIAEGGRHRNAFWNANRTNSNFTEEELVGKIAIMSWNHEPDNPDTEVSGTDWILAENWVPYQDDNFVTPAFAAYVSGHSTFSRAAAEVMAGITGSEYFPGGLGEQTFTPDYLSFEDGPTETVTLQWATYYDAADEAGISRLYGGIHVPADDFAGRVMGAEIGTEALDLALDLFVRDDLSWCNVVFPDDVNNDGVVSEEDVSKLIAEVNRRFETNDLGTVEAPAFVPDGFYDVTNDGLIIPRDVLVVVNRLNGHNGNTGSTIVAAIPEPVGHTILMMGVCILFAFRSRRTGRLSAD